MPDPSAAAARITRDDVAHVAGLARLTLTDDELDRFTGQLPTILEHADDVAALDLDGVPPTSHPYPAAQRDARRRGPTRRSTATRCSAEAPSSEDGMFRVPPVLGEAP